FGRRLRQGRIADRTLATSSPFSSASPPNGTTARSNRRTFSTASKYSPIRAVRTPGPGVPSLVQTRVVSLQAMAPIRARHRGNQAPARLRGRSRPEEMVGHDVALASLGIDRGEGHR